jgi:hypothetical protein
VSWLLQANTLAFRPNHGACTVKLFTVVINSALL